MASLEPPYRPPWVASHATWFSGVAPGGGATTSQAEKNSTVSTFNGLTALGAVQKYERIRNAQDMIADAAKPVAQATLSAQSLGSLQDVAGHQPPILRMPDPQLPNKVEQRTNPRTDNPVAQEPQQQPQSGPGSQGAGRPAAPAPDGPPELPGQPVPIQVKPINDEIPAGPMPGQPIAPPPPPPVQHPEGEQWDSSPNADNSQTSVIVPGTNGQTIDTTIHNADNTTTEVRARAEEEGTTVWIAHADGSHSVTFIPSAGQPNAGLQDTYTVPAGGDLVNGATSHTVGDGKGNWATETLQPNGDVAYQTIEKQPDGTFYVTDALPGGGTTTKAFRPGSPEFRTPWLVGETRPDHSGYLTRYDGSTKQWGPDGSGSITGGPDSTTTTFGTDQWKQKYAQTIDPINKQIVTEVLKDADTDHPWTEVIISDLEHKGEGHYRKNADGSLGALLWQRVPGYNPSDTVHKFDENRVVPDKYVLEPNPSGGVFVKEDGVILGTITTGADGSKVFKPTKEYGVRTYNVFTQEIILSPDQKKATTIFSIFGENWQKKGHRELNTQYGEFPGIPWAGSEKGANGQDHNSFSGKFGDAFLGTYQSMLPLAGLGAPGSPGVGEAWGALTKNLAKTAAVAALTLQYGSAGYRAANSGSIPGLNKGEANQLVSDLANSLGYADFRQGNFAAGMGTLLGTLAAASAINKAGGLVARPAIAGIKVAARPMAAGVRNALGGDARAGAGLPSGFTASGIPRSGLPNTLRNFGNHVAALGEPAAGPLIELVHEASAKLGGLRKVLADGADGGPWGRWGNGSFQMHVPGGGGGLLRTPVKTPGAVPRTKNLPRTKLMPNPNGGDPLKYVTKTHDGNTITMFLSREKSVTYTRGFVDGLAAPVKNADGSWTINLRMHPGWNRADFDAKAEYLRDLGDQDKLTKKSGSGDKRTDKTDTWRLQKQREVFNKARDQSELDSMLDELDKQQIDHAHDLQLGGRDKYDNMWALDAVTNHGMGGQINSQLLQVLDAGAKIRINIIR